MQFLKTIAVVGAFGAAMAMSGGAYAACSDNPDGDYCRLAGGSNPATPIGPVWWPSQWGADDEAGSTNHYKDPAIVLRALSVIKKGMTMAGRRPQSASEREKVALLWAKTRSLAATKPIPPARTVPSTWEITTFSVEEKRRSKFM